MKPFQSAAVIAASLALVACSSPETEKMLGGLAKAGLSSEQASCYNNTLEPAISTEAYNQIADYLFKGETLTKSLNRTRRKFGGDFSTDLGKIKKALDACTR